MLKGYRTSLKHPEAEELFDLWFFRPAGWIFVRLVHRTPITPNQVTMLSLAASLAAAWEFGLGELSSLAAAAAWYALANVLDCADGQLARVQGSGTPMGRVVDGVADYVGTTAIFLGIGIGFSRLGMGLWPEVVAAGLSSALHAAVFDHRQAGFIAAKRGDGDFHRREMEKHGPAADGRRAGFASRMYVAYMSVQQRLMHRLLPASTRHRPAHTAEDGTLVRLWSFLGPTTNRTALIAFALIGRVDLFLWAVVVPGNLWLAAVWYLQRRVDARAEAPAGPPDGEEPR